MHLTRMPVLSLTINSLLVGLSAMALSLGSGGGMLYDWTTPSPLIDHSFVAFDALSMVLYVIAALTVFAR